ncbi:uncharacterized protein TrAtP1_009857 [Trichoderma atroviride]|uniref:uncharacterized protein n=1 Tax=Hypocrea atroviridis TaxID=63577 RepID=UPI0033272DC9|nr:hypothetical protein TrAtP1_009857 [Trichoderma atroviride]
MLNQHIPLDEMNDGILNAAVFGQIMVDSWVYSAAKKISKDQRGRYKSDKPKLDLPSKLVGGTLRTWLTLRSLCLHRTPCFPSNHRRGRSVAVCADDAGTALAVKSAVVVTVDKILDASTGQVRISALVSVTFHGQAEKRRCRSLV